MAEPITQEQIDGEKDSEEQVIPTNEEVNAVMDAYLAERGVSGEDTVARLPYWADATIRGLALRCLMGENDVVGMLHNAFSLGVKAKENNYPTLIHPDKLDKVLENMGMGIVKEDDSEEQFGF